MSNPGNPPDPLDEFADEDSSEFRQVEIPTRREIDAVYGVEPYRKRPGGGGSFGEEDAPTGRTRVAGMARAAREKLAGWWAAFPAAAVGRAMRTGAAGAAGRLRDAARMAGAAAASSVRVRPKTGPLLPRRGGRRAEPRPYAHEPAALRHDARTSHPAPPTWTQVGVATAALFALALVGSFWLADRYSKRTHGSLDLTSEPAGAQVIVDSVERGVTPATISLPAGEHTLEIRTSDMSKTMTVSISAGATMSRAIDMSTSAESGRLDVRTNPDGAEVFLNGQPRGRSPVTLTDLGPGRHTVLAQRGAQSAQEVVDLEPGGSAAVTLSLPDASVATAGRSTGWLSIRAPMELEVFEKGRLLGTTRAGRVELPAGRRDLEFVNGLFGVRLTRSATVAAGRTTALAMEIPPGVVTIDATPWANVRIDGRLVGRTPLSDLEIEAGRHDVRLEHPKHGRRRLTIMVIAGSPLVVTADLTKR